MNVTKPAPLVLTCVVTLALISGLWLSVSSNIAQHVGIAFSRTKIGDNGFASSFAMLPFQPGETINDPKPNKPAKP